MRDTSFGKYSVGALGTVHVQDHADLWPRGEPLRDAQRRCAMLLQAHAQCAQTAQREGAQHRRRIDTQRVTLDFRPPGGQRGRSEIAQSFLDFGSILSVSVAWMIRAFAGLLPLLVVLSVVVFLWRRRRRHKIGS